MARVVETVLKVTPDKKGIDQAQRAIFGLRGSVQEVAASIATISPQAKRASADLARLAKQGKIDPKQFTLAGAKVKELNARLSVTQKELNDARSALDGLDGDAAIKQQAKVARLEKSYVELKSQILDVPKRLSQAYDKVEDRARKAAKQQARAAERAQQAAEQATSYDSRRGRVTERVGVLGDVDTALMTTSGALSGLGGVGGAGAATALTGAADLFAVSEQIGLLVPVIQSVGTTARNVAQSGGALGSVARAAQAVVPGLGATAAGMLTLSAVVLPIAALAAGAAFGLAELNKQQKKVADRAKLLADVTKTEAETYADLTQAIAAGDTDAVVQMYNDLTAASERADLVAQRTVSTLNDARAADQAQEAGNNVLDNFFDPFFSTQTEANLRELTEDNRENVSAQIQARAAVAEAETLLAQAGIDVAEAARQATPEMQALTEAEETLTARRQQAEQTLASLAEQETRLIEQNALQSSQLLEDRAVRDQREQEDYERAYVDHIDRLKDIKRDGLANLERIESEGEERIAEVRASAIERESDLVKKAFEATQQVTTQTQEKIADLQSDYVRDSLKREAEFVKQRLRAQEDLQDRLFDAELSNDILAITKAKRDAEKEQQRAAQDFNEENQERAAQKEARLAEIRSEGQQRIAEIQANLQAERQALKQATQERVAEERQAIQDRLAAEKQAIQDRITSELEGQQRIDEERKIRLARQAEDDKRADRRREESLRMQLQEIDKKRNAEIEALRAAALETQGIAQAAGQVSQVVQQILAQARGSRSSGTSSNSGLSGGGISSGGGFLSGVTQRFADGGIVPSGRGGFGYFEANRRFAEAVIPLTDRNLSQMGGNAGLTINGNINISGDSVTREEVRQELLQLMTIINRADRRSIRGA